MTKTAADGVGNPEQHETLSQTLNKNDEEEQITSKEELIELRDDLVKAFDDPATKDEHKTLGILKVLQRTKMTRQLLKQTLIGKTMTKITEKKIKDSTKVYFEDGAIKEVAGNLLSTWRRLIEKDSKQKAAPEPEKAAPLSIPFIPKDVKHRIDQLRLKGKGKDMIATKLIEVLQTKPGKGRHDDNTIIRAAALGVEIAEELVKSYPETQKLQSKFRSLYMCLKTSNPELRMQIVYRQQGKEPNQIVLMSDAEWASEKLMDKTKEIADYSFQAERTDAVIADQIKKGGKSEYKCKKCGKQNVSMYTMQTRSSDEPMTEFYNCRDCGYGWRICP